MTPLSIRLNLDLDPWTDLRPGLIHGRLTHVGLLPNGTSGGRACVALRAVADDGREIVIETTWRLFLAAARVLAASPVAEMEEL